MNHMHLALVRKLIPERFDNFTKVAHTAVVILDEEEHNLGAGLGVVVDQRPQSDDRRAFLAIGVFARAREAVYK